MGLGDADLTGTELLARLLEQMADRVQNVRAIWPDVGDVVAENLQLQFDSEGSHFLGTKWAPLSPKYLAWKIRKGFDPRRLRQTGAMADGLTSRPMRVEVYGEDSAKFWTDDPKAQWHQFGTRFMPARPIIVQTEDFKDDVEQVIARYMFEELSR